MRNLMFFLFVLGCLTRDGISSFTLDLFIHYNADGGSQLEKIHPGSWIIYLSCAIGIFFVPVVQDLYRRSATLGSLLMIGSVALCLVASAAKSSGLYSYLLDTVLIAPAGVFVIQRMNQSQRDSAAMALHYLVVLNALVVTYEFLTKTRLFPYPPDEAMFRPEGLFGHPLLTGQLTVAALPGLMSIKRSFWVRTLMLGTCLVGIVFSQARMATLVSLPVAGIFYYLAVFRGRANATLNGSSAVFFTIMPVAALSAMIIVLFSLGAFDRLLSGFNDDSTLARINVYGIFRYMTDSEFLYGSNYMDVVEVSKSILKIRIIESPVVLFIIYFGIIYSFVYLLGLIGFFVFLSWGTNLTIYVTVASWVLLASTNNNLGTKNPGFITTVVFTLCIPEIVRLARRRRPGQRGGQQTVPVAGSPATAV